VPADVEVVGDAAQVGLDLRLHGERARPVRVAGKGERVEVRRDVALAAGVRVLAPGAADVAGTLEDDEVVDAHLLEPDGGAEAGESGADHRDGDVRGQRGRGTGGRVGRERRHVLWYSVVPIGTVEYQDGRDA